ncbi:MAG: type II toxin-antitoxin system HicB family antitoxin [Bacteroidetes bacterium]|nr:MAG: type II toxin-antitoxin system HicB family antitoxin [Bacteroidota bacterium]
MKDKLTYKGFIGSVHFQAEDELFYGRIEGITDLVTFEGKSVEELKKAFEEAVEDYVQLCKAIGKEPYKSFKGSFNVRITPRLHRQAFEKATLEGITLNQLVQKAIEKEVQQQAE